MAEDLHNNYVSINIGVLQANAKIWNAVDAAIRAAFNVTIVLGMLLRYINPMLGNMPSSLLWIRTSFSDSVSFFWSQKVLP